ncbi:MAG: glycosyltransferase family 1 protein [Bacteroidota bacterium]
MASTSLHIISFDIPFPANYGGVIDVFYKITSLHAAGVKIHLHCFEYKRAPAPELERYCETVHYYPRRTGLATNFSLKPYIVASRYSHELLENLLHDDYPILFEGLHTCAILSDPRLKGRFLIYRESNIEHHYYYHLFKAEKDFRKRLFFLAESARLRNFQKILAHASVMLSVSQEDTSYLSAVFPGNRVITLPSFHRHTEVNPLPGKGTYALYHGKLSVPENSIAAKFLITQVWEDSYPDLVIAGLDPPGWLMKLAGNRPNIRFVLNPSDEAMFALIREAHVHIMVTFQPTGLKLKLLNALFNGRFCLVNPHMVAGTSLGELCILATSPLSFKEQLLSLFNRDFTEEMLDTRRSILMEDYSNQNNCKMLLDILNLC